MKKNNQQAGFVLPLVLIIMALIFSVGGFALVATRQQTKENKDYLAFEIMKLIQRSALEECQAELIANQDYTGSENEKALNGGVYKIKAIKQSASLYFIDIFVSYDRFEQRVIGTIMLDESGKNIKEMVIHPE